MSLVLCARHALWLGFAIAWLTTGQTQVVSSRRERSIGLTNNARINIGVQFILPLTLTLPYVSGRRKRSLEPPLAADRQDGSSRAKVWLEPRLRRLDGYFHHLNIDEEPCKLRLLCEMAADPDSFHPISELVLARISEGQNRLSREGTSARMRSYEDAVSTGTSGNGTCQAHFSDCAEGAAQLINVPVLNMWQTISDYFHIGLYDELDSSL